jgi:hypothetical protein
MLDFDLARVYGVETKSLNRAVKRNADRFPKDFMFQMSSNEWRNLKYQIGTSSSGHGGRRRAPYAFTEHGAIMAATVLNSPRAVQMSLFVVRAFLKMRALLGDRRELAQKLASLEKGLKKRLDVHEAIIVTILQRVMDIIDPPLTSRPWRGSRLTNHLSLITLLFLPPPCLADFSRPVLGGAHVSPITSHPSRFAASVRSLSAVADPPSRAALLFALCAFRFARCLLSAECPLAAFHQIKFRLGSRLTNVHARKASAREYRRNADASRLDVTGLQGR